MDIEEILKSLDYTDRCARRTQIHKPFYSGQWIFRHLPETMTHMFNSEVASVAGSDSDASCAASDSDSDRDDDYNLAQHADVPSDRSLTSNIKATHPIEAWMQTDNSILCITGEPGTGKSSLIGYLHWGNRALEVWRSNVLVLSHFVWDKGEPLLWNKEGFYRNLIYQILSHDSAKEIKVPSLLERKSSVAWSMTELENVLFQLLQNCAACIFVDNVDSNLLPVIHRLAEIPECKVCFTASIDVARQEPNKLRIEEYTYSQLLEETRVELWRPLRDTGLATGECMQIILRTVRQAKGVYLLLHLARQKILLELVIRKEDLLSISMPRDLSDLRTQLLLRDNAYEMARYFNLALSYRNLMDYSNMDITNHRMYDGLGIDISLLEMTLTIRPELRDLLAKGISAELISRIETATQEVLTEVLTHCSGFFQLAAPLNQFDVFENGRFTRGKSPSRSKLGKALYQRIELLPGAVSFFTEYGKAVVDLDRTTQEQWWVDIVKTYLVLVEIELIRSAHPSRVLAPLSKIGSVELLGECHDLYCRGKLQILNNFKRKKPRLLPPFLALAARPNLQDFVTSQIGTQATRVLQHVVDYAGLAIGFENILKLYYGTLAKLGNPLEKGILAIDVNVQSEKRIVMFESAASRIIKRMIQQDSNSFVKEWLQPFSQGLSCLKQRTSIGINVSTTEQAINQVDINDAHHWQRRKIFHPRSSTIILEITYTLEVDLAFLLEILQQRSCIDYTPPTGYVKLRSIQLRNSEKRQSYEVLHEDRTTIDSLTRSLHNFDRDLALAQKTIKAITDDISGIHYQPAENLIQCLLEPSAGYTIVEEEAFQKMCKEIR